MRIISGVCCFTDRSVLRSEFRVPVLVLCLFLVFVVGPVVSAEAPGSMWVEANHPLTIRDNPTLTAFDNKLWVIGGFGYWEQSLNDVWYSSDGVNWIAATHNAEFSGRGNPTILTFDNKLWLIGGYDYSELNDVWHSANGVNWTQATSSAAFPARSDASYVVYDDKMWIIGGISSNSFLNDTWYSTDGIDWVQATPSAAFPARFGHGSVVFDDKMWIFGGRGYNGHFNDVWNSVDGINWMQVNTSTPYTAREGLSSIYYNDKMWIIGGANSTTVFNDFWYSTDGITWIPNSTPTNLALYNDHFVVYNDEMWTIRSQNFDEGVIRLWSSTEGTVWNDVTGTSPFPVRDGSASVYYDNKIWVIGGWFNGQGRNDVWYSSEGVTWTQAIPSAAFSGRRGHTSLLYDGKMWIIGGSDNGYSGMNDVWYSEDGVTWTQAIKSAVFPGRLDHTSLVFDNKMWVIAGKNQGTNYNDVWYSTDGATWTQVISSADFSARSDHSSEVYDNKMWVIGGAGSAGKLNDVWNSADGSIWYRSTASANFPVRDGQTSVVYKNLMWVIGGKGDSWNNINDIWYSVDGITWSLANSSAAFPARTGHTSVVSSDGSRMWVIGGEGDDGIFNDVWYSESVEMGLTAGFMPSVNYGYAPLEVQFTDHSTAGNAPIVSYNWDFGDGTNSILQNPNHTFITEGIYIVTETVTDSDSRQSSYNATINVAASLNFSPVALFMTNVSNGTAPLDVQFIDHSAEGSYPITSYYWDFGDGTNSTLQNPNHTFMMEGNYVINETITDSALQNSSYNATIIVTPPLPPLANFTMDIDNGTAPLVVQFTDHSLNGSNPITSYYWDFGDGTNSTLKNPTHSFTQLAGNRVTETVTDSMFKNSSYNATITVLSKPVSPPPLSARFAMDTSQGCAPLVVYFTDFSQGLVQKWQYNFGDGGGSNERNPTHMYSANTGGLKIYQPTLTVTDADGKTSTYSGSAVTMWGPDPDAPIADFNLGIISSPPNTPSVQLTDKSQRATWMTYYFGDGTEDQYNRNPAHSFPGPGFYRITQSVTNKFATRNKQADITFYEKQPPQKPSGIVGAQYTIDYSMGNSPLYVRFFDQSWGDVRNYSWDFGDGTYSTEKNPRHVYAGNMNSMNIYQPTLTVTDAFGAVSSYTSQVTVFPIPLIVPTTTPTPEPTTKPTTKPTTTTTTTATPTGSWTVTPTTTGSSELRLTANPTEIKYTSWGGSSPDMSTLYTIYVTISNPHDEPVPIDFSMDEIPIAIGYNEEYQANRPVRVDSTNSIPAHGSYTFTYSYIHKWHWTDNINGVVANGAGTLGNMWDVVYFWKMFLDTYKISPVMVTSGALVEKVAGAFGYIGAFANYCTLIVGFTHPSEYRYIPHASNVDGLTAKNVQINVGLIKLEALSAGTMTGLIAGTCTVTGLATSWSGVGLSWLAAEVLLLVGEQWLERVADDPDPDYMSPVVIEPVDIPELDQLENSPVTTMVKQMVPLVNHSQGLSKSYGKYLGAQNAGDQIWEAKLLKDCYYYSSQMENDYEMLNTSAGPAVEYMEYLGYHPTMDDVTQVKNNITSNGLPEFEVTILKRNNFSDEAIRAIENQTLDSANSFVVDYNQSLFFLFNLRKQQMSEMTGLFATNLGPNAPPYSDFTVSTTSGMAPLNVRFNDASLRNASEFTWDFGDNNTIITQSPTVFYTYMNPGNYTVTLMATSPTGSDTRVKYELIHVRPDTRPVANFTSNTTTGLNPLTVEFNDTSSNTPISWEWDFGDNSIAIEQNPVHTYYQSGNYTVTLNATNADGSGTFTATDYIIVLPNPPLPNFTAAPLSGKAPLTVQFNDTSSGGQPTLRVWEFGDGTISTEQDPVHTYTVSGNYNVSLELANGDADVFENRTDYITVLPPTPPVAEFLANTTTGNAPLAVQFTDASTNTPTAWEWSFGDGYVSTEQNPVHRYSVSGTYDVSLNATNTDGSGNLTKPGYITVTEPGNAIDLIDQLIVYIDNQRNVPHLYQRIMIGELMDVKRSLNQNRPGDAVMGMKFFKLTVSILRPWPLTKDQASTMQNSADAIIKAINLPVNQAAIDQTKSLSADVKDLHLSNSIERSLVWNLDNAEFMLECGKDKAAATYLNIFIGSVRAQDGKKIPHDKAAQLVAKAEAIKSIL